MKRPLLRPVKNKTPDDLMPNPTLSFEESREILNSNGITYTDEEIKIIREFMSRITEITAAYFQRLKENNTAHSLITPIENHDPTESIPLHPRQHRRAG
ncbi:MAG: hypothetical protein J0H74_15715 [Chitinophagaceae bacterium]|nr:hypothetical protein [Chitinophagaceae bacterium]